MRAPSLRSGSRATRLVAAVATCTLALGILAPEWDAAAGPPGTKVPDAPYPADFRARVRKAIEAGVTYLRTKQVIASPSSEEPDEFRIARREGIAFRAAAAVTWVLRRAGVAPDDSVFAVAGNVLRSRPSETIEEAALVLLALCAEPLPQGDPFAITEAAKGGTGPPSLNEDDRALMERTVSFVLSQQIVSPNDAGTRAMGRTYDSGGGWCFDLKESRKYPSADIPSTYLALLGLEAAARRGARVPSKTWTAALDLLVGWQARKGPSVTLQMNEVYGQDRFEWSMPATARGFGWSGGALIESPSGFETAAGALGLVMCQDALQKDPAFTKDLRKRTREGIRDALAWVQQNYDIGKNPVAGKPRKGGDLIGPLHHHQWLQALARLSMHSRMRKIGGHDWYQEGAEVLLGSQREDGSWAAIWWENCYALLFLLRASLVSVVPVVTVTEGG